MNGLTIIYMVALFAIGALIGMIIELFIDAATIRDLQEAKHKLQLENEQLRKSKSEVIEIVDNRSSDPENLFKPF